MCHPVLVQMTNMPVEAAGWGLAGAEAAVPGPKLQSQLLDCITESSSGSVLGCAVAQRRPHTGKLAALLAALMGVLRCTADIKHLAAVATSPVSSGQSGDDGVLTCEQHI